MHLVATNLSTFIDIIYSYTGLTICSFIGKAVSSQSLDAKQPQPEVASSPETTPASPQTDQPKLRKWFRHKEQLSGGGVSLKLKWYLPKNANLFIIF